MAPTLEDLDRRVTALEKAAATEKSIVRAVSEIVAESEKRINAGLTANEVRIVATEKRLEARMAAMEKRFVETEQRLTGRISSAERRMVDILNERFDAVMVALDRPRGV